MEENKEFKFSIVRHVGVLAEGKKGWKKEVNLVSWNDRPPKLDLREWDENHEKMETILQKHGLSGDFSARIVF